jgi:hypothetical protein
MADRKISDLTALTTPAAGDFLPIVDISEAAAASKNKRITIEELMRGVPDGTAAAPGIAFETYPSTGIYSSGANQLAVATNGTGRLFVDASGNVGVGSISAGDLFEVSKAQDGAIGPVLSLRNSTALGGVNSGAEIRFNFRNDSGIRYCAIGAANTTTFARDGYIYFQTNPGVAAPTERLRITSAGKVGIGVSAPAYTLDVAGSTSAARIGKLNILDDSPFVTGANLAANSSFAVGTQNANSLSLFTNNNARLSITSAGLVGIGTTSPGEKLVVYNSATNSECHLEVNNNRARNAAVKYVTTGGTWFTGASIGSDNNRFSIFEAGTGDRLLINPDGSTVFYDSVEQMRIDSSGRLLVGTSTARQTGGGFTAQSQVEGSTTVSASSFTITSNRSADDLGPRLNFARSKGGAIGSNTIVDADAEYGGIYFFGADGTDTDSIGAQISAYVDGTPGANDMPGRLVFSTTSDSASSPTERMRIDRNGLVDIGGYGNAGLSVTTPVGTPLQLNRTGNDGELVRFKQDGTTEGNITVSGTTVSYNGAHLARWSQLASGAERTEILRGSVLSNLDEMCEWSEEDNEQLNRMKVSDVEGDPNVSGVFQSWDDDDDTYTNDFYCAMTGDFIIRIAEGVTVERGDLLMSAGDGTAKPQDDDIIRSKTIAKVTSTNVSCTYADGSYCVPCVLMAC